MPVPQTFAASLLAAVLIFVILAAGKAILVPLVIAIFLWYLINAIAQGYGRVLHGRRWMHVLLAVVTVIAMIWTPVELVHQTIPEIIASAPEYEKNIQKQLAMLFSALHLKQNAVIADIAESLNVGMLAGWIARGAADFAGNTVLIILYVIFLLLEQGSFHAKTQAIFHDPERSEQVRRIVERTAIRVQSYIRIKTLMSLLIALPSYALMAAVGLDFAAFWGALVFFCNFIPSIGAFIATFFPALLALVQFPSLVPFIIVAVGLTGLQFVLGNFVESKMMGNSLNLSPLVILISLVVWGSLWGIAGMFLCVPMTVIAAIIFAEIPTMRPFAVLLSSDGKVE